MHREWSLGEVSNLLQTGAIHLVVLSSVRTGAVTAVQSLGATLRCAMAGLVVCVAAGFVVRELFVRPRA